MDRKLAVLLIEDSVVDAKVVCGQLSQADDVTFQVEVETTFAAGIDRVRAGGLDVILLDLNLPDTQGLETFLKAYHSVPHVPIIVVTALADMSVASSAVRSGAQDYLVKGGMDTDSLVRAIYFSIERHRRLQRLNPHLRRIRVSTRGDAASRDLLPHSGTRRLRLRERDPEALEPLSRRYCELIELACAQRKLRLVQNISEELHGLAMYLCTEDADSSDVEDIHRASLESLSAGAGPERLDSYVEEGQLVLVELLRYLADTYRDCVLGTSDEASDPRTGQQA